MPFLLVISPGWPWPVGPARYARATRLGLGQALGSLAGVALDDDGIQDARHGAAAVEYLIRHQYRLRCP